MRSFWSLEELQQLKQARLKGLRAKSIARFLDRTESAVNKALRRYNLLKNPEAPLDIGKIRHPEMKNNLNLSSFQKRLTKAGLPLWVEFKDVLQWLKVSSIPIVCLNPRSNHEHSTPSVYHGKAYTAAQIVLLANRLRDQQNLLPFLVEGITLH